MKLAVFVVTKRPNMIGNILRNLKHQIVQPDSLVIMTNGFELNDAGEQLFKDLKIKNTVCCKGLNEHYRLVQNHAITQCVQLIEKGMVCLFDDDDYYGPKYLSQIKETKDKHPDAIIICKHSSHYSVVREEGEFYSRELFEMKAVNGIKTRVFIEATLCIDANYWANKSDIRLPGHANLAAVKYANAVYQRWMEDTYTYKDEIEQIEYNQRILGIIKNPLIVVPPSMPWAPFYTTGPEEFYFRRFELGDHKHTWTADRNRFVKGAISTEIVNTSIPKETPMARFRSHGRSTYPDKLKLLDYLGKEHEFWSRYTKQVPRRDRSACRVNQKIRNPYQNNNRRGRT